MRTVVSYPTCHTNFLVRYIPRRFHWGEHQQSSIRMSGRPPIPIPGVPPSLPSRRPPPPTLSSSPDEEESDDSQELVTEEYYSEFHGDAEIQAESPPPPPPPRPGAVPVPQGHEEYYSEFHGDAEIQAESPPLPPPPRPGAVPVPRGHEEIYDDFEPGDEQQPLQDVYADADEVGPPPPPPPSSRPPPAIPSSSAPPLPPGRFDQQHEEVYEDPEEPQVYEAVDETPAIPPTPPNRNRRDPPPMPEASASRPEPRAVPPPPKGGIVIDASSLQSHLGKLRRTNAKPDEKSGSDKVYTDNSSFDQKKKLFERRSSSNVVDAAAKSLTSSKTPSIVSLSKPPIPSRPSTSTAKLPSKPPHSYHSSDSDSGGSLKSPTVPVPLDSPGSDGSEELYDDGSSFQILDPLVGNSWYFPKVERKESERLLNEQIGEDGTFLVRKSSRDPKKPYTIDVIYQRRIYHLQVRQRSDGNYALGTEKDDEMYFKDVKELVGHHKKKEVILIGDHAGSVLLKKSP